MHHFTPFACRNIAGTIQINPKCCPMLTLFVNLCALTYIVITGKFRSIRNRGVGEHMFSVLLLPAVKFTCIEDKIRKTKEIVSSVDE